MNTLIESLNGVSAVAAPKALSMLWQSSLLIGLVLTVDVALRRKVRPAVLHGLWLVVLLKLLLPPALSLPTGLAWWLRPPTASAQSRYIVRYDSAAAPANPAAASVVSPTGAPATLSGSSWALAGCTGVSFGLIGWMFLRWRQVARQVRTASPAPDDLNGLLDETRRAAALRGRVGLRLIDGPVSPAVYGLVRPMILLPRRLAEELPVSQLRVVLLHELLHLRRGDLWIGCAQALLQAAYWWHPLVWLANARLRRTREEAVDDAVMRVLGGDADDYPSALLHVARFTTQRPAFSLGLVGILESPSALRQRIQRLLNSTVPDRPGLTLGAIVPLLAFGALALPMGQAPGPKQPPATQPLAILTNAPPAASTNDPLQLYTRVFKVDPNSVAQGLAMQRVLDKDGDQLKGIRTLLARAAVDLQPPRALYYKDREGALFIRGTQADLAALESLLQTLSETPRQVNIKVKFIELSPAAETAFWGRFAASEPSADGLRTARLSPRALKQQIADWERREPGPTLAESSVTTLVGRQCQVQWVDTMSVVGYTNAPDGTIKTNTMPIGPSVDVLVSSATESNQVQLTTSTAVTELLGYDDAGAFVPQGSSLPVQSLPMPRLRLLTFKPVTATVRDAETLVVGGTAATATVPPSAQPPAPGQEKHLLILLTPTFIDPAGNPLYPQPGE